MAKTSIKSTGCDLKFLTQIAEIASRFQREGRIALEGFSMLLHRYYLPPPPWKPRAKPQPSTWHMSKEQAASRGLTDADIVPGSEEERGDLGMQTAGHDGVR